MNAPRPKKQDPGAPAWVTTFADLMTLLMCFFVLILSFSEMEIQKFKQVAGSMKFAFGVQREIRAKESPKGTSIIAQEFSPGKPTPTPLKVLRQNTTDDTKQTVDFTDARVKEAKTKARILREKLKKEIKAKLIDIEQKEGRVIIRIREKGSFPLGSALMSPAFKPILKKIASILATTEGTINIGGHTDDLPIRTELYRSNWDLSSARAVSVVHVILEDPKISPKRVVAEGHADVHPLVENKDNKSRSRNRRVEIIIEQDPNATQQLEYLYKMTEELNAKADKKDALKQGKAKQPLTKSTTPTGAAPKKATPSKTAPKKTLPKKVVPTKAAPQKATPKKSTSQSTPDAQKAAPLVAPIKINPITIQTEGGLAKPSIQPRKSQ